MKVVISAHFDLAKKVKFIKFDVKGLHGLVDNFAGVMAAYDAAKETGAELYLTNFEEVNLGGATAVAKKLKTEKTNNTVVIVVDTCTDTPKGKKAYIGNVYNFDVEPLKKKFGRDIYFMPGLYEPTEDETAVYGDDFKMPTFFFGIPITGKYHATDNTVAQETIDKAGKLLIEIINYL